MNTSFICKKLKLKKRLEEFNLENDEENGMPYSKILNLKVRTFKLSNNTNNVFQKLNKRMECTRQFVISNAN